MKSGRIRSVLAILVTAAGALTAANAEDCDQVDIIRDEYGVPHIYAATMYGLGYAQGYAQAQDRLWQADLIRHAATGTLSAWFGPPSLSDDTAARALFGPPTRQAAIYAGLSDDARAIVTGLVDGINAWIVHAQQTGQVPVEYAANGLSPEPWTVTDSIAIYLFLMNSFGASYPDELFTAVAYQDLVGTLGQAEADRVFADTHPLDDPSAYATIPGDCSGDGHAPHLMPPPALPSAIAEAAAQFDNVFRKARHSWRMLINDGPHSNAVLIGPSLSADGQALLLGGPQVGRSTPQFFHEVGLHGAGVEATGIIVPGVPLVAIGVAPTLAWTITTGYSDNVDIFQVALNPNNPQQYWHGGTWIDMNCRAEQIQVRGVGFVTVPICETIHGPLIAQAEGYAFAMREAYRGHEGGQFEHVLGLIRATSPAQVESAASQASYNFNLFVADIAGNIAFYHVGRIPMRAPGSNPLFPLNGDGSQSWQGVLPWSDMPKVVNPEQGYIVNWNNKPACEWLNTAWDEGWSQWGPVARVRALARHVAALQPGSVTVESLEDINRAAGWTAPTPLTGDGYVPVASLLQGMLPLADASADPRLPDLLARLATWNQMLIDDNQDGRYDDAAVTIFDRWMSGIRIRVGAHLGLFYTPSSVDNVLARLIADDEAAIPLQGAYLGGQDVGAALTEALIQAADDLTSAYGADPNDWLNDALVNTWASNGAIPDQQTPRMNRGTYNQIVHLLPAGPVGKNVVAPGQSGDVFSPHSTDQLALYSTWQYKPMRLTRSDVEKHAESTIVVSACPPCSGDINGDGHVNQTDLGILVSAYGTGAGGDIDRDGDTDQADLGVLLAVFGASCR